MIVIVLVVLVLEVVVQVVVGGQVFLGQDLRKALKLPIQVLLITIAQMGHFGSKKPGPETRAGFNC